MRIVFHARKPTSKERKKERKKETIFYLIFCCNPTFTTHTHLILFTYVVEARECNLGKTAIPIIRSTLIIE